MIKLVSILKESILNSVKIEKVSSADFEKILDLYEKEFNNLISREEIIPYIKDGIDSNLSYKAVIGNQIVGTLLLGNGTINDCIENEVTVKKTYINVEKLKGKSALEGIGFLIEKQLRGTQIDRQLLNKILPQINNYDYVWAQVYTSLKTHNYWKRFGLKEAILANDGHEDIVFYIKING